jgi:hypothetical protein
MTSPLDRRLEHRKIYRTAGFHKSARKKKAAAIALAAPKRKSIKNRSGLA